ncbi:hypothetical protein C8R43DRAFT_948835 [Mycena crocata]|nr:hypothetical protein C8R43DRAFT_948835 [Mycena crocata]
MMDSHTGKGNISTEIFPFTLLLALPKWLLSLEVDYPPHDSAFCGLIANTGCSSTANASASVQLGCIRSLPIDEFRKASVGAMLDGDFIDVPGIFEAYRTGKWVRVAFLINTDEGRIFAHTGANTTADVIAFKGGIIPHIEEPLKLHPDVPALGCSFNTTDFQLDPVQNRVLSPPGKQDKRLAAIVGDVLTAACRGPCWLAQLASSDVPFWKFRFNHKPCEVSFGVHTLVMLLKCTTDETKTFYVFNLQNDSRDFWKTNHFVTAAYLGPGAPIADRLLGVYMSRAWASFAATGDPNNANGKRCGESSLAEVLGWCPEHGLADPGFDCGEGFLSAYNYCQLYRTQINFFISRGSYVTRPLIALVILNVASDVPYGQVSGFKPYQEEALKEFNGVVGIFLLF